MKCNGVVFLVAVFLITQWVVSISSAFISSTASIVLTKQREQTQTYQPASRGIPGRRESGATR